MSQIEVWDKKWSRVTKPLAQTPFAELVLKKTNGKNYKTLLDIGAGDGKDSIYFAKNGLKVTATDFSNIAIRRLNKQVKEEGLKIKSFVKDTKELYFEEKFDVIYSNLAMHYFTDKKTKEIIKNLNQMLNKGGLLCIKCKSIEDIQYGKGEEIEKNMFLIKGKRMHLFSEDYMKEILEEFTIIHLKSYKDIHIMMEGNEVMSGFIEAIAKK
jgi:tellurite methyltransferase